MTAPAREHIDADGVITTAPELPGMPERPAPLWAADPLLASSDVRTVSLSVSGSVELSSSEPGHHVLADGLRHGEPIYLQVEGRVTKRGIGDAGGLAVVKVRQAVRADVAGVIALQETLDDITARYRNMARFASAVLGGLAPGIPAAPPDFDDSPAANRTRNILRDVEDLRWAIRAARATEDGED